jgi:hypothetical protein
MNQPFNSKRQVFKPSLGAVQVRRPEQNISTVRDQIKRPEIFLKLDAPVPDQPVAPDQDVHVKGWLAASEPFTDVIVEIGESRQKATTGVSWPDLAEAYPDVLALAERAARAGHTLAQFQLGVVSCTGEGVPKDLARGVAWCEAAAKQGHALGQYNLAVMVSKGRGCERNMEKPVEWFKMAAEQGVASAQAALGEYLQFRKWPAAGR